MSKWISVKDDLPDMGEVVLVAGANEYPITAFRTAAVGINPYVWHDFQDINSWGYTGVTHWMYLPKLPEQKS